MIRLLLIAMVSLLFVACNNKGTHKKDANRVKGKLKFTERSYNFKQLKHGDVVGHRVKVINEGVAPVVIQKVENFCGCTEVKYTRKPIEAKDTVYLEVILDTKGYRGRQVKRIEITANDSIGTHEFLVWAEIK